MMKKIIVFVIVLFLFAFGFTRANAQTSASSYFLAQPIPDRTVTYSASGSGVSKPIIWGLDAAWPNEGHIRRGIAFMGAERVDLMRASFQPTHPLVNGDLQQEQIDWVNFRISLVNLIGPHTKLAINSDHPSVDPWYSGNAARWAELMDVTTRRFQEAGREVVTIGPFNEPDYGWGQGSKQDFYNITTLLKQNPRFDNIRISGGNTLNCDAALEWYQYLKPAGVNEGNTHQLAGSFDNYASFFQVVRANGDHATADELHNVMEAIVGVEYGMQTGIWWATAELARGEFVKASDGVRLGYAEHRPNWTAAAVYRSPEGKVQAFGGTSERQAVATTYRFLSKDRDVYYDGYGPQREYTMAMPGGTGYQQGQTNAERVVNITWGDDIQPVINGRYVLVNRSTGKVIEVAGGSSTAGANLQQGTHTGAIHQQWNVTPVDSRVGGDFSYFKIAAEHSGKAADIFNFSLDNGGQIVAWDNTNAGNQHWYLDYAEDGWFYIRSRHNAKCLDIATDGINVVQWDKLGTTTQQWRLLPVGAALEFSAPAAPADLVATANAESIRLNWSASAGTDIAGYTIFRSASAGGTYNTIARNVPSTSFIDNTATTGGPYFYKIKAVDRSLNRSGYSNEVSATPTGNKDLVIHLPFDGNTLDKSVNLNHGATLGSVAYGTAKVGSGALTLNGVNTFVQLSADLANQQAITIAAWVYWNGGASWQRIFDFGNGESENMFLSPSSGSGQLRFAIKNGGAEQSLTAPALATGVWSHVAVTMGTTGAKMYVNGQQVAESSAITIRPLDFKPVLNYIGRSQYPDPLFKGRIDDFKVYNYALSPPEIANLGIASSYHQLRNRATGMLLDGLGATTNGSNVGLWAATTSFNSHWDLVEAGSGYYQLQNRATSLYLDGMGRATDGSPVGQSGATTQLSSHWTVEQFDGVYYRIQNRATGLFLDGLGFTTDGADAGQWSNTVHPNSQWEFVSTPATATASGEGDKIVSVEGALTSQAALLYPNPTSKVLTIQLKDREKFGEAQILSMSGQVMKSAHLVEPESKVEVGELPNGIYIVEVTTRSGTTRAKLIKQ